VPAPHVHESAAQLVELQTVPVDPELAPLVPPEELVPSPEELVDDVDWLKGLGLCWI